MSVELTPLREGAWSLDDLVDHANRLLPELLPKDAGKRAADAVNQRLVRHYATQGLLDEPLKEGREARYLYRHLLQLLVVRRLLAEGFSAAVVGRVIKGRGDAELESLLTGQLRIDVVPQSAARAEPTAERAAFLKRVRERAGLDVAQADPRSEEPSSSASLASHALAGSPAEAQHWQLPPSHGSSPGPFQESTWSRVEIMAGLELMVRDDFRLPDTRLGDNELVQLLKVTLLYLEQKQRGKP